MTKKEQIVIDEVEVVQMYANQKMSIRTIANKFCTYPNRIRRILVKNDIPLRTHSEAQKLALEEGRALHPTKGHPRAEEIKRKIAQTTSKRWENDEARKEALVERNKQRWASMSDAERDESMKKAQDGVRQASVFGSKLEKAIANHLTKLGYDVEYHVKTMIQDEGLELDLYVPSLAVAIEIDGPSHFEPIWGEETFERNQRSDRKKYGLLMMSSIQVVRLKNMNHTTTLKVIDDASHVIEEIMGNIKNGTEQRKLIEVEV